MPTLIYAGALSQNGSPVGQIRLALNSGGGVAGWARVTAEQRQLWIGLRGELKNGGAVVWGEGRRGQAPISAAGTFAPLASGDLFGTFSISEETPQGAAFGTEATLKLARTVADTSRANPAYVQQTTIQEADRVLAWLADSAWEAASIADRAFAWAPLWSSTGGAAGGRTGGLDVDISGGSVGGVNPTFPNTFDPNTFDPNTFDPTRGRGTGGVVVSDPPPGDTQPPPAGNTGETPPPVDDGRTPVDQEPDPAGWFGRVAEGWKAIPKEYKVGASLGLLGLILYKKRRKNG